MAKHYLTVGSSKTGKPIQIDITNPVRAGLLGASGSGKSVLLMNIILLLAKEMREKVQFVGFDPKLSSLLPVADRLICPVISEPSEFLPMMQKLEQTMLNRYSDMRDMGITKIDPWDEELSKKYPQIIVIFEELLSITNNSDIPKTSLESIKKFFLTYTTRARAANMGFIFCSHTYSQTETISVAARSQIDTRFLLKSGINECKLMAEGMDEMCPAYQISESGEFYFATGGNFNVWTKGKTFFNDDSKYEQLAKGYAIDVRDIGLSWSVENPFDF